MLPYLKQPCNPAILLYKMKIWWILEQFPVRDDLVLIHCLAHHIQNTLFLPVKKRPNAM